MKKKIKASEVVFMLVALTACVGFLIGKLPVDQFMLLASGAFVFYFAKPGNTTIGLLKSGGVGMPMTATKVEGK